VAGGSTQIVSREPITEKAPSRLTCQAAFVARQTHDVEQLERLIQVMGPEEIEQMNIVVYENQDRGIGGGLPQSDVINNR
jgi:hypothetical protein